MGDPHFPACTPASDDLHHGEIRARRSRDLWTSFTLKVQLLLDSMMGLSLLLCILILQFIPDSLCSL